MVCTGPKRAAYWLADCKSALKFDSALLSQAAALVRLFSFCLLILVTRERVYILPE